jgi:hypothetical protein
LTPARAKAAESSGDAGRARRKVKAECGQRKILERYPGKKLRVFGTNHRQKSGAEYALRKQQKYAGVSQFIFCHSLDRLKMSKHF